LDDIIAAIQNPIQRADQNFLTLLRAKDFLEGKIGLRINKDYKSSGRMECESPRSIVMLNCLGLVLPNGRPEAQEVFLGLTANERLLVATTQSLVTSSPGTA
jgi:hypothetical protein